MAPDSGRSRPACDTDEAGRESLCSFASGDSVEDFVTRLLQMENEAGAPVGIDAERWHDEMRELIRALGGGALRIENTRLREDLADYREAYLALRSILKEYADPRNWGISRDDLNYRVVSWIGPGADEMPFPRPMRLAQDALDGGAQ